MTIEAHAGRACQDCGDPVVRTSSTGRWPLFCPDCGLRRRRARMARKSQRWRDEHRVEQRGSTCIECRQPIVAPHRDGPVPERCSTCQRLRVQKKAEGYRAAARTLAQAARRPRYTWCHDCREVFIASGKGPIPAHCPRCKPLHLHDYRGTPPWVYSLRCPDCNRYVKLVRKGYSRRACDDCARKRQAYRSILSYQNQPRHVKVARWRESRRRRSMRLRELPSERFADREIFERDDWKCQICGAVVDPAITYPDPRSPSLDHLLPVSYVGSTHTRDNVRLACLGCNLLRQNRVSDRELHQLGMTRDQLVMRRVRTRRPVPAAT